MSKELRVLARYVKTAVAAILFLCLLVGGAGAVLSVAATGLDSFTGSESTTAVVTTSNQESQSADESASSTNSAGTNSGWVNQSQTGHSANNATSSLSNGESGGQSNGQSQSSVDSGGQTVLESPVVDALDKGGNAMGNQIQNAFGNVLANFLQVLFVEQSVPSKQAQQQAESSGN